MPDRIHAFGKISRGFPPPCRCIFIPFKNQGLRPSVTSIAKYILIGLAAYTLASLIFCFFYVILRLAVMRVRVDKIDDEEMQGLEKQEVKEEASSSSR